MQLLHRTTAAAALTLAAAGSLMLASPAIAQDDQNCDDFTSQAAAQAHYRADPSDPDNLDADDDMVACENYTDYSDPAWDDTPVQMGAVDDDDDDDSDQVSTPPQGGVATGGGSTSGVEHAGLLLAGGLALTVGAGGLTLAARRSR